MSTTITKVLARGSSGHRLEPLRYRGNTPPENRDGVSFETPTGSARRLTPINNGPTMRTIEIQTMYRESEAQTDPYSPEYILKPGQPIPEILHLASQKLKFPIGPKEILIIERARERRAKEANLPPLDDPESIEKRKKILEEMEEEDWKYREEDIRERQLSKLEYYKETTLLQEQERELINTYKLQSITFRSNAKKDGRVAQIEQQRLRTLRKLAKDREHVERKQVKRDIIKEYSDFASKVYAPVTRDGIRETVVLQDIKPPTLASLAGIETLQSKLFKAPSTLDGKVVSEKKVVTLTERAEKELAGNLEKLEESIKASKTHSKHKLPLPSVAEKIEKPPPRPPTPEVDSSPADEEEVEQAVLLLQYLLRGRAIQTLMYEGKERRKELIGELKSAEDYKDVEIKSPTTTDSEVRKAHKQKKALERRRREAEGILDDALGYIIGASLDFLSKELVRVQEERRIAAMVEIAESTRKDRETNEMSQREREHQLRLNQDEQFRQIMEIHQGTATTFFEDCLEDAFERIQRRKAIAKQLAEEEEERRIALLPLPPEQVIADVVFGFLFPLVERKTIQRAALLEDKKYPKAAWDAVEEVKFRVQYL